MYTAPEDYESVSSELTFDPMRSRACILVALQDDDLLESVEEIGVSLTTEEDQVTLSPDVAVIAIMDTDGMLTSVP